MISISPNLISAILAFMEQPSYSVDEATGNIDVCVVLEGTLETNLSLVLITMDISATGTFKILID